MSVTWEVGSLHLCGAEEAASSRRSAGASTSLLWDALKQLRFAFFPSPSEKPHSVTTCPLGSERLTATYLQVQGQPENADKALIDLQSPHKTSYLYLWFLLGCSSAVAQPV